VTEVRLTQVLPAQVEGKVLTADSGEPVAAACVYLKPRRVKAAVRGPFRFTSDWNGAFLILRIPPGLYDAEVTAPGCERLQETVEIASGSQKILFRPARIVHRAELLVSVRNAARGTPVTGALVTLAEAWPTGIIRKATTEAAGTTTFSGIPVGERNTTEKAGETIVARRPVTLHVEAQGYTPTTVPVILGQSGRISVPLSPTEPVSEREPNDTLSQAQPLPPGSPVKVQCGSLNDRDLFSFRLATSALVRVEIRKKRGALRAHKHSRFLGERHGGSQQGDQECLFEPPPAL